MASRRRGQASFLLERLLTGLLTLAAVTVLVFLAVHLIPGSYADVVLPPQASDEQRQALVDQYGLDRPLVAQYWEWLRHAAVGDFGHTLGTNTPIKSLLADWIPVTVELAALSTVVALALGLPLAVIGGMSNSTAGRGFSRLVAGLAMSTPDFVIASVFLYLFSRYSLGLTINQYVPFSENPEANLRAMVLPAVSLGVFGAALIARTGRDAIATVLNSPHILAATARGETWWQIFRHHIVRNAMIPVLTVLAAYVGYLLGGAVIVESLFTLPGLGQAVANGITFRDYPVVQTVVLIAAAAFITINMLADIAYGVIDPRVHRDGGQ